MSMIKKDTEANKGTLDVENILADFFLKKFEMRNSRSAYEDEHQRKSKHKKHKKSKHKLKTKSRSSSPTGAYIAGKIDSERVSSSEEKDIQRLKKIKNIEARDNKISLYLPTLHSTYKEQEPGNLSSFEINISGDTDLPYGPSLELLLTGSEVRIKNESGLESSCHEVSYCKDQSGQNEKGNNSNAANVNNLRADSEIKSHLSTNGENILDGKESSSLDNEDTCTASKDFIRDSKANTENKLPVEVPKNQVLEKRWKYSRSRSKSTSRKTDKSSKSKSICHSHSRSGSRHKSCSRGRSRSRRIRSKSGQRKSRSGQRRSRSRERTRSKSRQRRSRSRQRRSRSRQRTSRSRQRSSRSGQKRSRSRQRTRQRRSRSSHKRSRSVESWRRKGRHLSRTRSKSAKKSRSKSKEFSKRILKHSTRSRSRSARRSRSEESNKTRMKHFSRSQSKSAERCRSKESSKIIEKHALRSRSKSVKKSRSRSKESSKRNKKHSSSRSRSSKRSRSRSKESNNKSKKHSSRSRSRSIPRHRRTRSRSYSRDRYKSKHSYKSNNRHRYRSRSREYSNSRSRRKSSPSSRSRSKRDSTPPYKSKSERSRSKSREKNSDSLKSNKIDQAKILQIAQKNVLTMIEKGTLPEGLSLDLFKKEQLVSLKSGGKSVQELTDFCAKLSERENEPDEETKPDLACDANNQDGDSDFIHHPFKLKEQPVIKLNIKNAVQIPIKTHAEKFAETAKLSSQFPVSSGNQHKQKELEWIPVVPDKSKAGQNVTELKTVVSSAPKPAVSHETIKSEAVIPSSVSSTKSISHIPLPALTVPVLPPPPLPPMLPPPPTNLLLSTSIPVSHQPLFSPSVYTMPNPSFSYADPHYSDSFSLVPNNPELPPADTELASNSSSAQSSSFKPMKPIDISSIVTKRFQALTKLQEDANDATALQTLQEAQSNIQEWVESKQVPGLFTGSTDAKLLTVEELCGPKHWNYRVKRDIFTRAAPVTEGKGMSLLKKMGWNPGEGLGKNKEGSLEPLLLDVKTDKKGLVSMGEGGKKPTAGVVKELQGKHPVSALMELCSKRKWKPPLYSVVKDQGPPHKKIFLFKVEVNGVDYLPATPSSNKKIAKADAAVICLQALNVFPK